MHEELRNELVKLYPKELGLRFLMNQTSGNYPRSLNSGRVNSGIESWIFHYIPGFVIGLSLALFRVIR